MLGATTTARLFLNDMDVGAVSVQGWHGAWGFGEFTPDQNFDEFEPLFSRWAGLMHHADINERLTPQVSAALRTAEYALYRIKTRIFLPELRQWRNVAIVNIDGGLIEWKESGPLGSVDKSAGTPKRMFRSKIAS